MKRVNIDFAMIAVSIIAFMIPLVGIRITFFQDDWPLLGWANIYSMNPAQILLRGNTFVCYYRPVQALFWVLGYSIWKTNYVGFQFLVAFLFSIGVFYLYRIGRVLGDKVTGFTASIIFVSSLPTLVTVIWKAAASV